VAGLLVWSAVREKPIARLPVEPSVMVAKNQTAPGATRAQATPPAKSAQPESIPQPERLEQESLDGRRPNSQVLSRGQASNEAAKEPAKKGGVIGGVAGGEYGRLTAPRWDDKNAPLPAGTPVGQAAPSRGAKDASPAVSVDGLRGGSGDQAVDTRNAKIESAKKPAEGNALRKESAAAKAAPPAPVPAEPNRTSVETYAAAPQAETAPTEKQKKPAEHPSASAAYELRAENSKMLSGGIKPRKVFTFAPDPAVRWSFGPSGLILRSTDGGKSWNQQQSGTTADLVAGSAPSEKVCWVVGAKGTILLTTDGEHWTKIFSPTSADLIGVVAQDARRAEVWSDAREPHYFTQDGGQTWTRRGAQ
jgi:hypothetical protein